MGRKRSHEDVESDAEGSVSSASNAEPSSKRSKQQAEGTLGRSRSKKRVRTIRKQLEQDEDLAADVRLELKRELAVHEAAIAEGVFQKQRAAMIAKYHKARFFERKKAMRLVKRLKKAIAQASDEEETKRLRRQLHVAEVDEIYSQYFPHIEPYISLYAKSKPDSRPPAEDGPSSASLEALLDSERPPMWTKIEQAMKEGPHALKRIRETRPAGDSSATGAGRTHESKSSVQDKKKPTAQVPDDSDKYPPVRPLSWSAVGQGGKKAPAMNRRERRRIMRETASKEEDEKNEGESFFEGL